MPGMQYELAYELLLSQWLTERDAVAMSSTSKTVATQMLHACVWYYRGRITYRLHVPWSMRLNIWLRTATCNQFDQVLRLRVFKTWDGTTSLKTRTCRACGRHTQRKVQGTTLCEDCTRDPWRRCFMISRVACQLVLMQLGYQAMEAVRCMMCVKWSRTRDGTMAFVHDVCKVTSVSVRHFLMRHREIGSPR
jgi:hypothetical protein